MKYDLALVAVMTLGLAGPALAQDEAKPRADAAMTVIRESDGAMTCLQLGDEAARLSQTMGAEPEGGLFGMLGGVARSGAAMLIPGAGLAMAGVDMLTKPGEERREAATLAVQHRWYYLNGLYAGRRCREQGDAVAAAPADAAAPVLAAEAAGAVPVADANR